MNSVRSCTSAALLFVAVSCPAFGQQVAQQIAANEPLPDAPSYRLRQEASAPQSAKEEAATPEGTSSVHGVVTDVPGDVIPGAKVELEGEGKSEPHIATSANDGSFSFTKL